MSLRWQVSASVTGNDAVDRIYGFGSEPSVAIADLKLQAQTFIDGYQAQALSIADAVAQIEAELNLVKV